MTLALFWMPTSQINARPSCGDDEMTAWMPAKNGLQPTNPAPQLLERDLPHIVCTTLLFAAKTTFWLNHCIYQK
jgi:hypothetical protein